MNNKKRNKLIKEQKNTKQDLIIYSGLTGACAILGTIGTVMFVRDPDVLGAIALVAVACPTIIIVKDLKKSKQKYSQLKQTLQSQSNQY